MIEINNIRKSFSGKNILNNISFKIKKGVSVAIIGQSGVGKSVLLKHLNGLIIPDLGKVIIDKKIINELSFNKLQNIRKKMSMVFQFGALFDSLTIKDNILIALDHLTKLSDDEKKERISISLSSVNLNNRNVSIVPTASFPPKDNCFALSILSRIQEILVAEK